ncbi:TIGR02530 family flagellar biosynthesis protein [Clostridium sp.]|uniref:TIGR02530 family flagellar biosynthesis protein n=1 Tax=Clostridium sp. TaxID=1506 RepID=UPI00261242D8|nr:TIGR02530 family flagellar biosynthesis protein [Clostridium sp.]
MSFRVVNGKAYPIGNFELPNSSSVEKKNQGVNFKDVLNETINKEEYTVSKHASERLKSLDFSEEDMRNIGKGFEMAEKRGAKNSVMLYKDVALITSIENKTLITAIEKERAKDNIYTNIDSVVIL